MSIPDEIARILEETDDADEALRRVVSALVDHDDIAWAAVAFLEGDALTVGPASGTPLETARTHVTIAFGGEPVGELQVDGTAELSFLELVADRIAPHVLIGWDTGGEAWEP